MSVKWLYLFAFLLFFQLEAAPQSYSRSPPSSKAEDLNALVRQLRTYFIDVKREVGNHEAEIRMFEERLRNQELATEQLNQQIKQDFQFQQDSFQTKVEGMEQLFNHLDLAVKGIVNDLRQLKTQANDLVGVMAQYKDRLSELEKLFEAQRRHMQNLEDTLKSVVAVIQTKEFSYGGLVKGDPKSYIVQEGDTLGGIARKHKVTVQVLREANQMESDRNRILVGQKLKIP